MTQARIRALNRERPRLEHYEKTFPELYAALEAALPLLDYPKCRMGHGDDCPGCQARKAIALAEAALKKAKGL
jgi:hypothetical protein